MARHCMIAIKSFEFIFWRNRFADHPVVLVNIDPNAPTDWKPSHLSKMASAIIQDRFPAVGKGHAGETTGCFLAAICLSMQQEKFDLPALAGGAGEQFWFAAIDQSYAFTVANHAVSLLNWLIARPQNTAAEMTNALRLFEDRCEPAALDQSIRAILAEADIRGIPWFRLGPALRDVQLGQGHNQKRMRETVSSNKSSLAAQYARNKALSLSLLSTRGLPVGRFGAVSTPDEAVAAAKDIGFPVVLKPIFGRQGEGVVIGLTTPQAVREAAERLLRPEEQLLVQSFIAGDDHRLLVVSGRFVAAARREPAAVVGDGNRSIEQLIAVANSDPRRGKGYRRLLSYIVIDDELNRVLAKQGFTLSSIPPREITVRLRLTANISTGGTAVDLTDAIHPDNARLAERAALTIGLDVAGVDFITPDIKRSWREVGGGICEVNVSVGLRPHWLADPSRDVVGPILNTIFPPGTDGRIPTALVTGSNGKTTTTRMLHQILRAGGYVVGSATTDGVKINDEIILEGDVAGPNGASMVLRDPTVSAAVLETARGGIIKRGIYLDRCDVAALLNIDREQIEMDEIESLDDMAQLKRKVIETARDAFVFNSEDRRCLAMAREFPVSKTILFSLHPSTDIDLHVAAGGIAVTLIEAGTQETIVIRDKSGQTPVLTVDAIPATYGGLVRHNIANALAAVALAQGMGMHIETMAAGLSAFSPSLEHSLGRFNIIDTFPARILFDFANNPPALETTIKAIDRFACTGRRICAITAPGNRPDHHIEDCARAVVGHFDYYICFERDEWRRGRAPGEIARYLEHALIQAGIATEQIASAWTQQDALVTAARIAGPDDFLVIFGTDVRKSLPQLRSAFGLPPTADSDH